MSDPTDHGQQDEALRRAATADQTATAPRLLLTIADRLTTTRPASPILPPRRAALALRYATEAAGYDTPASHTLERSLLRLMPEITRPITRGEYALLLRAAAGRITDLHRAAAADYGRGPRPGAARNALAAARVHGNSAASAS
ncbi:hypothetical protein STAN_1854 [Streptomyces sp. CBMAI 2042]|uniref:hypothetical protein n=1 Tax=Streptomyces sp. CBMAI 2042 TaxID=2305222 RepID=UPI000F101804|nr:hypothetical protein [Streptomyces sp. CBMAI 2042]RLV66333.1 hypothetical protein STAN_1854 [Streptomyces sp. CBMAI 2042]